jgi:hypothetical protein
VREPSWTYSDYAVFVSLDALGTGAVAITHSNSDAGPGIRPTTATIVPFYLMVGTPLSEIAATVFAANSPNERGLS